MIEKFDYRENMFSPFNLNPIDAGATWQWCGVVAKYENYQRNLTDSPWIVHLALKDLIEGDMPVL